MKTNLKKLTSLILAVCMVVGLMPLAVAGSTAPVTMSLVPAAAIPGGTVNVVLNLDAMPTLGLSGINGYITWNPAQMELTNIDATGSVLRFEGFPAFEQGEVPFVFLNRVGLTGVYNTTNTGRLLTLTFTVASTVTVGTNIALQLNVAAASGLDAGGVDVVQYEINANNGSVSVVSVVANFDALRAAVDAALLREQANYTPASWTPFFNALTAAQNVLANPAATQTQVNNAANTLNNTMGNLVRLVNFAALQAAVDAAVLRVQANYTPESWAPFLTARNAGQMVLANSLSTQTAVDTATNNLTTAMGNLVARASLPPNITIRPPHDVDYDDGDYNITLPGAPDGPIDIYVPEDDNIVITIPGPDDEDTTITVPPGSDVYVDEDYNVTVTVPPGHPDGEITIEVPGDGGDITVTIPGDPEDIEVVVPPGSDITVDEDGNVTIQLPDNEEEGTITTPDGEEITIPPGSEVEIDNDGGITINPPGGPPIIVPPGGGPSFTLGDVDLNGSVNIADVILLFQSLGGHYTLSPAQRLAADVTQTGTVAVGDAIQILQFLNGHDSVLRR